MLLFSYYVEDKIDKAWFDSSNIYYAECDESDTQEKTVRVVFKNGKQYQYNGVSVNDWVMFKNADSQGKKLNELFKKAGYEYSKLDDANLDELEKEYVFRTNKGYTLLIDKTDLILLDNKEQEKYRMPVPSQPIIEHMKGMLESFGNVVRTKNNNQGC